MIHVVKWRLMLTTLPVVVAAVLCKVFIFDSWRGIGSVVEFSDLAFVLTGGVFLVGFMLAGTMADYKEAERLPAEVVCSLETIEETFAQAASSKPALNAVELRACVRKATDTIHGWLYKKQSFDDVAAALEAMASRAQELERAGATPIGVRAINELHGLRRSLTRMHVISQTGFLSTGYALLETLATVIVGLLMISRFKSFLAETVLVGLITLIYVYMVRLIRDIDDPFEYQEGGAAGAAEVDLEVFHAYRRRLVARSDAAPGAG